jgi:uncharacterized protein YceK
MIGLDMAYFSISEIKRTLIIFISIIVISGCSIISPRTQPTRAELEQIGFGVKPKKELYQSMIKDYFNLVLKFPHSAHYETLSLPVKVYDNENSHPLLVGFLVCIDVDFKNELGKYTEETRYGFLLRDREILKKYSGNGTYREKQIVSTCSDF